MSAKGSIITSRVIMAARGGDVEMGALDASGRTGMSGASTPELRILQDEERTLHEIEQWSDEQLERFVDAFSHREMGRFLRKGVEADFFEDCDSMSFRDLYYKKGGHVRAPGHCADTARAVSLERAPRVPARRAPPGPGLVASRLISRTFFVVAPRRCWCTTPAAC